MTALILGWYSLVLLVLCALANIAHDKTSGGKRAFTVISLLPIIAYVAINLFN